MRSARRPLHQLARAARQWRERRHFFAATDVGAPFFGQFQTYWEARRYAQRYCARVAYELVHGVHLCTMSERDCLTSEAVNRLEEIAYPGIRVARLSCQGPCTAWWLAPMEQDGPERVWTNLSGPLGRAWPSNEQMSGINLYDVLFASGAIPYLANDLYTELLKHDAQPAHLLLEGLPLTTASPFVTLHKVNGSVTPLRVENGQLVVERLTALGYRLVQHWRDSERFAEVAYADGPPVELGHGMHFQTCKPD